MSATLLMKSENAFEKKYVVASSSNLTVANLFVDPARANQLSTLSAASCPSFTVHSASIRKRSHIGLIKLAFAGQSEIKACSVFARKYVSLQSPLNVGRRPHWSMAEVS